jgi:hypothetical protein
VFEGGPPELPGRSQEATGNHRPKMNDRFLGQKQFCRKTEFGLWTTLTLSNQEKIKVNLWMVNKQSLSFVT